MGHYGISHVLSADHLCAIHGLNYTIPISKFYKRVPAHTHTHTHTHTHKVYYRDRITYIATVMRVIAMHISRLQTVIVQGNNFSLLGTHVSAGISSLSAQAN